MPPAGAAEVEDAADEPDPPALLDAALLAAALLAGALDAALVAAALLAGALVAAGVEEAPPEELLLQAARNAEPATRPPAWRNPRREIDGRQGDTAGPLGAAGSPSGLLPSLSAMCLPLFAERAGHEPVHLIGPRHHQDAKWLALTGASPGCSAVGAVPTIPSDIDCPGARQLSTVWEQISH